MEYLGGQLCQLQKGSVSWGGTQIKKEDTDGQLGLKRKPASGVASRGLGDGPIAKHRKRRVEGRVLLINLKNSAGGE